jgi:hypothetical protein
MSAVDSHAANPLTHMSDPLGVNDATNNTPATDAPATSHPAMSIFTDNPYVYVIKNWDPHGYDPQVADPHGFDSPTINPHIERKDSLVGARFNVTNSEVRADYMTSDMSLDVVKVSRKVLGKCNAVSENAARAARRYLKD